MRFMIRALTGMFLLAATLGLLALSVHFIRAAIEERLAERNAPRPARERVFAANLVTVEAATVAPVMTAFGSVESRRMLELRAPAAGRVVMLADAFEEGGRVGQGDLLLRIDPAPAQAALDLARTARMEAEAELGEAERALVIARDDLAAAAAQAALRDQALERQRSLAGRGLGTASEREAAELASSTAAQAVLSRRQALAQAEARLNQARTGLERQRITLAEAGRDLAETELHAAFAGALSNVSVIEGGLVSTNEKLADLIDPDALEVSFRLSTAQFARLIDGSGVLLPARVRAVLDIPGADLEAKGTLARVGASVGEGLTGRLIYARLDAAPGFRPGDFVTVRIEEPVLEAVAVLPSAAVDSRSTVLVLGAEDRLELVRVEVLRRQGDEVIIRAGDLAGREVVAERSPLLGAGIKVRPIRPEASARGEAPLRQAEAAAQEMIELSPERRAQLIAFVEGSEGMPAEARERVLAQLSQERVPAGVIARLEERMGG